MDFSQNKMGRFKKGVYVACHDKYSLGGNGMLNSIVETRKVNEGLHNLTLQINEKDYFAFYEGLSEEDAEGLIRNYLLYHGDDGRPEDIKIKHNRNAHLVTINAALYYTGNEKTVRGYDQHDYLHEGDS